MVTQLNSFSIGPHLYPLCLKLAADRFREGKATAGLAFFEATCESSITCRVYKQLWKIKGRPMGDLEYGRKSFHDQEGLSSSLLEKAQAIDRALKREDKDELCMREGQVYKCLWMIHGMPSGDPEYGRHAFNSTHGRSASQEEIRSAIGMYSNESEALSWIIDGKSVHLIKRAGGNLETLVIDDVSKEVFCAPVNHAGLSREEAIFFLSGCNVTVDGENVNCVELASYEKFPQPIDLPEVNKRLQLVMQDGRLIWRLLDNVTKTLRWMYAGSDEFLIGLDRLSPEEAISSLQDFAPPKIFIAEGRLVSVVFEKITARSQLDPSQILDMNRWAVTLVNYGSSGYGICGSGRLFGHAAIAYEGVRKGISFLKYIHLTQKPHEPLHPNRKSNEAEIEFFRGPWNGRGLKTATWTRTRGQVKSMKAQSRIQRQKPIPVNSTGQSWSSSKTLSGLSKKVDSTVSKANIAMLRAVTFHCVTEEVLSNFLNRHRQKRNYPGHGFGLSLVSSLTIHPTEYNCLTWDISALSVAGIILPRPEGLIAEPRRYIKWLAAHPELVRFREG